MTTLKRSDWRTPRWLFELLNKSAGGFVVDAAADQSNALCERFYGPGSVWGEDALSVERWASPAFCNPPYERDILKWCEKFAQQAHLGVTTVALLPAKIETRWWYEGVIEKRADVIFVVGRVQFDSPPDEPRHFTPRFPSAVVIYGPKTTGRVRWWDPYGEVDK